MSFILEALKKSENERQRTVGPSLADVQVRAPREEKPWWAFAVGALLIVNLAVLLFVLLRDTDAEIQPASAVNTEQPAPPSASLARQPAESSPPSVSKPPVARSSVGSPAVRSLADEAMVDEGLGSDVYPLENPNLAAAANVPEGPPIVRPIEGPSTTSYVPPTATRAEPAEVLPTVEDLAASGTNLPEMHLDIHVHSPVPSERFVFVNMRKYIEGQTLAEGPAIERITSEGVVLNHRGMRFLLPRQ